MFKRILVNSATRRVFSVRNMGGGHHHAPPQGGLDGVVRKYLPEDYQVVLGIMGFYTSLYLLSKLIFGGGKKKGNTSAASGVVSDDGEIPSVDSPNFDSWISVDGNMEKLFTSAN